MPSLDTIKDNPSLVGDGGWPFEMTKPVENETVEVPPPPSTEDLTDARGLPNYQMTANPRGVAVVINNKIFTCGMKNREGTDKDAAALQRLFTHLGFFTNRYNDLTGTQIRRTFNELASIDHKKFDCLLIAVLTHGIKGKLYGTDGELIPVEDLTKLFNGYRCPSLIGKPKIFLLQACRGGNFDYGVDHDMTDGDDDNAMEFLAKASEEQFESVKAKTFEDEVEETDSGYTGLCIICFNSYLYGVHYFMWLIFYPIRDTSSRGGLFVGLCNHPWLCVMEEQREWLVVCLGTCQRFHGDG